MTLLFLDHMGFGGFFLFPFAMFLFGVVWLVLLIWVVYDVATRDDMWIGEKAIWVAVALLFNVLGPLVYILVVYLRGEPLFEPGGPPGARGGLRELERLADLRERGAITEEEYEELKWERLDRIRDRD